MATLDPMTLRFSLSDCAAQLDEIHSLLFEMEREAGEYKDMVSRIAVGVRSTSSVLRAASHVITSMESHKEHEASRMARQAVRTPTHASQPKPRSRRGRTTGDWKIPCAAAAE